MDEMTRVAELHLMSLQKLSQLKVTTTASDYRRGCPGTESG